MNSKINQISAQFNLKHHSTIYGWGRKPSFYKAEAYAKKHGLSCLCLEDGFIRSLGLGKEGFQPLSIVVDQTGIYFDSTEPSDLECFILKEESEQQNIRAQQAIQLILEYKITKYNQKIDAFDAVTLAALASGKHILVVDQTFGDQSIKFAGADEHTFTAMLHQAHQQHPDAMIWIKTHPDVLAGKSLGYFTQDDFDLPYVKVMTENVNPFDLFVYFSDVYVVSSQMGFEALLAGKKVHCFGVPWYAGWGLTEDSYAPIQQVKSRRSVQRSLEHLFTCAYFKYARYVSPVTGQICELEDILKILIPNIQFQQQLPQKLTVYGFSPWKKKFIADYLGFPKTTLKFKRYFKPKKHEQILAWGKKAHQLKKLGYPNVITVEDGFIRSVGLGASLIRPCSLVFDDMGIYYDATRPSRIEHLFNTIQALSPSQQQRIEGILTEIQRREISKYNVGAQTKLERPVQNRMMILVVGQVEDDMSIQLGGVGIKTNLALLQAVRLNHPEAYIIYKPHPDVEAGLRIGGIPKNIVLQYADQIENEVSIHRLFEIVDQLHTISSLSGFEALIKGLKVHCYGLPFYAGWGLTIDEYRCERRMNVLNLRQLLYVALIEYPTYNLAHTTENDVPLVNPENVIEYLSVHRSLKTNSSSLLTHLFPKFLKSVCFWKK